MKIIVFILVVSSAAMTAPMIDPIISNLIGVKDNHSEFYTGAIIRN